MAKIYLMYENDGEIEYKERILPEKKIITFIDNQMRKSVNFLGFYTIKDGEVDNLHLYGYRRHWQEVVMHPNFVCYDQDIYKGLYQNVILLQTGHLIAETENTYILMKNVSNQILGFRY